MERIEGTETDPTLIFTFHASVIIFQVKWTLPRKTIAPYLLGSKSFQVCIEVLDGKVKSDLCGWNITGCGVTASHLLVFRRRFQE